MVSPVYRDIKSPPRRTDVKVPEIGLFLYQNVPFPLDYYEICHSLLNTLVLIYNRLYHNETSNFERIDKSIMENIIDPIVGDVSKVAEDLQEKVFGDLLSNKDY